MLPTILRYGDTIGIVTLGSPISKEIFFPAIEILHNLGYKTIVGKHALDQGFPASSAEDRASDLMTMFENPDIKLILNSRGGTGSADIIPYLDLEIIKRNPKIFSGYSDITNLLNYIYQATGLITFHGLMLNSFSPEAPIYNYMQFLYVVANLKAPRILNNPPTIPRVSKVPGIAVGPLAGGNLATIINSIGTPYEIDTKGKILLLEDIHEETTRVYVNMRQLKATGKLDQCAGFILGEWTDSKTEYGKTVEMVLDEFLLPLGKPIVANVTFGHDKYNLTLPIGTLAELNANANTLTLLKPSVKTDYFS